MTQYKYGHLVEKMTPQPNLEEEVVYAAEIKTGETPGVGPDTVIAVTRNRIISREKQTEEETKKTLEFEIKLDTLTELRCEGILPGKVVLKTDGREVNIPLENLDTTEFIASIVENSRLRSNCEWFNFGKYTFAPCKWATCLGCALILVGIAFCVTLIGILIGLPFIAAGIGLLIMAFVYQKICDKFDLNIWRVPTENYA